MRKELSLEEYLDYNQRVRSILDQIAKPDVLEEISNPSENYPDIIIDVYKRGYSVNDGARYISLTTEDTSMSEDYCLSEMKKIVDKYL
jgi:hypothetical protein